VTSSTKTVTALAVLQGLLITNNITVISLGSLTGYMLAQEKSFATLPATAYIAGGACSTFLLSQLMRRYGRRAGFTLGALAGMAGAAICTTAVALQSFWLFCLGTLIAGLYNAAGGYYRFAAADVVSESAKSRAISFVLAGGIIGGVLGPESSKITKSLLSKAFMGSYAALILFALVALAVIRRLDIPAPKASERTGHPRPLATIVRRWGFPHSPVHPVFSPARIHQIRHLRHQEIPQRARNSSRTASPALIAAAVSNRLLSVGASRLKKLYSCAPFVIDG